MERARSFYERVFKVELEVREIDGNEMALFPHTEGQPGASGALARGSSYIPGKSGARVYFGVANVAETLELALSEGAEVNYPVTEVPEYGWVAEFIDTEGNCVALFASHSNAASAAGPSSFRVEPNSQNPGRRGARWACGQAAFEPVHMSTGRLPGERN
jgi:predicted enzyme related to lactoylglutathione lyase